MQHVWINDKVRYFYFFFLFCSILIEHAFFQPDESSWIFEQLLEEVPWKQEYITIKGMIYFNWLMLE